MFKKISIEKVSNLIGMLFIALASLGYILCRQVFAEKHIQFAFLDFPIFVGEQLFFLCIVLCVLKWVLIEKWKFTNKEKIVFVFFSFVLLKAGFGYAEYGPLALRHAALYNYILFIYFGYYFFNTRDYRNIWVRLALLGVIFAIFYSKAYYRDWFLTLLFFGIILIGQFKDKKLQAVLFLVFAVITPWKHLFIGSRMLMVGNLISVAFLTLSLCLIYARKKYSVVFGIIFLVLIVCGYLKMSDKTELQSMVRFDLLMERYKFYEVYIAERSKGFVMEEDREVKLYNPSVVPVVEEQKVEVEVIDKAQHEVTESLTSGDYITQMTPRVQSIYKKYLKRSKKDQPVETAVRQVSMENRGRETELAQIQKEVEQEVHQEVHQDEEIQTIEKKQTNPDLDMRLLKKSTAERISVTMNNFLFRVFIWMDMYEEMVQHKSVLGFHFGKPLRSKRLEATSWGRGEWGRDGWVAAHNSFFHIIYRTGILGFILIGWLVFKLWKFSIFFINSKSLIGILLCTIIVGWFVKANFLLGFEFPYSAIPLWAIFGVTYKYYEQQSLKLEKVSDELEK